MRVDPSVASTSDASAAQPAATSPQPRRAAPASWSVLQSYRRRHSWQSGNGDRRDALRCWLASFVLHLALTIALGSLLLPVSKAPPRPLLLSFATELSEVKSSPPAEKVASVVVEQKEEADEADAPRPEPIPPAPEPKIAEPKVTPPTEPAPSPQPVEQPKPAVEPPPQVQLAAAGNQSPRWAIPRQSSAMSTSFRSASLTADGAGSRLSAADVEQRRMDDIVEQFIRYDIGQLRGDAGRRALRNFEQLGPEAIPALVRGLNRSASIHASCPVGVITSKLRNALSANDDPVLLRYAIANIGRGVPETAPHRARLESMLKNLAGSAPMLEEQLASPERSVQVAAIEHLFNRHAILSPQDKLRLSEPLTNMIEAGDQQFALAAHRLMALMTPSMLPPPAERLLVRDPLEVAEQWREHWRRVGTTLQLEQAEFQALSAALESQDLIERQAAAVAIARRTAKLTDGQKLVLARRSIQLLAFGDHDSQHAAQAALVKLAAPDQNVGSATVQRWRAYWNAFERVKLLSPRATSYLSMAKLFHARGQHREAVERYRKVVAEFPDTPSAAEAERLLAQLTNQP